jgi:hypothetical protein
VVTKEHILSEIRRTAEGNNGEPLGGSRFLEETGIRVADWRGRYWARWSEAVAEAGLKPNQFKGRTDDDHALRKLADETRRLGHFPTIAELRLRRREDQEFPGSGILKRLGPKRVLAERLIDYCDADPGLGDLLEIAASAATEDLPHEGNDADASQQDRHGFVYLLKSGKHYKIGRTNSVGRRHYELAIQLPERADRVHEIATDDPEGIEAYWHKRFAARRRNGEWFELSSDDVAAFRRRKFM